MRWICVPEDLTLPQLLALEEVPPALGDMLQEQVHVLVIAGQVEESLALSEQIFATAWADHHRYIAALALLHKADALFRLQCWEAALEDAQRALRWIEAHLTKIARYNEAITHYFLGLLHTILHADTQATRAFIHAQARLDESERHWGYQDHSDRVRQCQNVIRWMKDLRVLQMETPPGDFSITLACYEMINRALVRTSATHFSPFEVSIPGEVLAPHLPPRFIPLDLAALPFLPLHPHAHYLALKIPADGYLLPESRVDDLLVMETATPTSPGADLVLGTDQPFIRRTDGRVIFRPHQRGSDSFEGIPRWLIREEAQEL